MLAIEGHCDDFHLQIWHKLIMMMITTTRQWLQCWLWLWTTVTLTHSAVRGRGPVPAAVLLRQPGQQLRGQRPAVRTAADPHRQQEAGDRLPQLHCRHQVLLLADICASGWRDFFFFFFFLRSPAISLGFTTFGWDFCVCDRFFNPTIKVVTFRLRGWCVLGMFLLPAFTRLGHERQDLLSPCDEMHVCTD